MADRTLFTQEQALAGAAVIQTSLAASLLRFFTTELGTPTVTTTRAEMIAAEAAFVGYPAGGYPLAAFLGPNLNSGGGADITSPLVNVAYASGDEVALGGAWIDDGDDAPRATFIFDPPRTLAQVGDGFPFLRQLFYGINGV